MYPRLKNIPLPTYMPMYMGKRICTTSLSIIYTALIWVIHRTIRNGTLNAKYIIFPQIPAFCYRYFTLLLITIFTTYLSFAKTTPSNDFILATYVNGKLLSFDKDSIVINAADDVTFFLKKNKDSKYSFLLGNYETDFQQSSYPLAVYSNLEEGRYQFSIQKNNRVIPLTTIIVQDTFFKKWSFLMFLIIYLSVLIAGAGYFIYLSYTRNKSKVSELRMDWSNKLHNDIGGDLSSVLLRIQSLKTKFSSLNPILLKRLNKTEQVLKEIQQKLKFAYDLMDTKKISIHIMLAEIRRATLQHFEVKNIKLEFENSLDASKHYNIGTIRINKLYLVLKEIINNCVKYSETDVTYISIREESEGILIIIRDDGIGFDINNVTLGNGLNNLKQYSREGLITVNLESNLEEGTHVEVFTPYV